MSEPVHDQTKDVMLDKLYKYRTLLLRHGIDPDQEHDPVAQELRKSWIDPKALIQHCQELVSQLQQELAARDEQFWESAEQSIETISQAMAALIERDCSANAIIQTQLDDISRMRDVMQQHGLDPDGEPVSMPYHNRTDPATLAGALLYAELTSHRDLAERTIQEVLKTAKDGGVRWIEGRYPEKQDILDIAQSLLEDEGSIS